VREILGTNTRIDLMVVNHTDADHLGQADDILGQYDVRRIIRTGQERDTANWRRWRDAVAEETKTGASVMNLQSIDLVPGTEIVLGDATVTLVAGWGEWTEPGPDASERRNAVSVVLRLEYRGGSVLFPGDTVGRRRDDHDSVCKDAERRMVDNAANVPLESDVLIAPHHGGALVHERLMTCTSPAAHTELTYRSSRTSPRRVRAYGSGPCTTGAPPLLGRQAHDVGA
jgi:competence protein ComEC